MENLKLYEIIIRKSKIVRQLKIARKPKIAQKPKIIRITTTKAKELLIAIYGCETLSTGKATYWPTDLISYLTWLIFSS